MNDKTGQQQSDLDRDQAISELSQAITDREQDANDIEQKRIDKDQEALDAQAAAGTLTGPDVQFWQGVISAAQDRRDSHQQSLDISQGARDAYQRDLDNEQAKLSNEALGRGDPEDPFRPRAERLLERARAAEARAAAQQRAKDARLRAEQHLKRST